MFFHNFIPISSFRTHRIRYTSDDGAEGREREKLVANCSPKSGLFLLFPRRVVWLVGFGGGGGSVDDLGVGQVVGDAILKVGSDASERERMLDIGVAVALLIENPVEVDCCKALARGPVLNLPILHGEFIVARIELEKVAAVVGAIALFPGVAPNAADGSFGNENLDLNPAVLDLLPVGIRILVVVRGGREECGGAGEPNAVTVVTDELGALSPGLAVVERVFDIADVGYFGVRESGQRDDRDQRENQGQDENLFHGVTLLNSRLVQSVLCGDTMCRHGRSF